MRFAVLMQGVISGMGREEKCELLATKTIAPDSTSAVYSHCAIIEASGDLPDGEYTVEFAGQTAQTQRNNGCWIVGDTSAPTFAALTAFMSQENSSEPRAAAFRDAARTSHSGGSGQNAPQDKKLE